MSCKTAEVFLRTLILLQRVSVLTVAPQRVYETCVHLLQRTVAVGQIQSLHTVRVTQEGMQILFTTHKQVRHTELLLVLPDLC